MKNKFLATCATIGIAALSFISLSSCDEGSMNAFLSSLNDQNIANLIDAYNGCPNLQSQYEQAVQEEGQLITIQELKQGMENNTVGFSMAMLLNKSGVNKLFEKATDWSKFTYGTNGVNVTLKLPTINLDGCPQDVLTNLMTELQGDTYYASQIRERNEISCITMDLPISVSYLVGNYEFSAKVGLPIYGKIKGDDPNNAEDYAKGLRTAIFADLKHAQMVDLQLGGLNPLYSNVIQTAINLAWQHFISKEFRNYALFDIGAWEVGNKEIKMIAGAPIVNSRSKTIQLGMYSNVVSAKNSRTAIDDAFPDNADIGLNIHPDLIRGLIARMMREGHIKSDVTQDTNNFMVTMPNIADEYPETEMLKYDWYNEDPQGWGKYFSMAFRMWSNNTSMMCGYIDLIAGLNAEITENKFEIGIGNVHAGKSSGGMTLVATAINTVTQSDFFQGVLDYTKISFNFNEIEVSGTQNDETGSNMQKQEMGAMKFTIDGNGISLFLNFMD